MTTQTITDPRFRVIREEGGAYWLHDARTGARLLSTGDSQTILLRAVGDHPRRVFEALSPDFEQAARERIVHALRSADLQSAIGCFLDDAPDFNGQGHWAAPQTYTLLEEAIDRPDGEPAREAALSFLHRNYASFEWFAGAWGLDIYGKFETLKGRDLATGYNVETQQRRAQFVEFVAESYFAALSRALRAVSPALLNLGVRLPHDTPTAALRACGRFADVISLHTSKAELDTLHRAYLAGGKPLLVITNVEDAHEIAQLPTVVGVHAPNANAEELTRVHTESTADFPTEFREPGTVTFLVGPIADKPLQVDLLAEEPSIPAEIMLHAGASASLRHEDNEWHIDYNTGNERGIQVLFAGPKYLSQANAPEGATDLNGYNRILLDAEVPQGLEFKLVLHEGGAAPAGLESYDTRGGDQGQAFETNLFVARNGRRRYTYALEQLIPQTNPDWQFGNQHGSGRVHMQSIRGLCLALVGKQGKGTITLHGLKFYRG